MTDTIQDTPSPNPLPPERPMPRLGRGGVWSETVAEIERDQAKRQAACKETAVDLNGAADPSTNGADPSTPSLGGGLEELGDRQAEFAELRAAVIDTVAEAFGVPREMLEPPSELPVAPNLGAHQEDPGCDACGRPRVPHHDASAPGPTMRHPYRARGGVSDDDLEEQGAQLDAGDFAEALGEPTPAASPSFADMITKACDEAMRIPPPAPYVVHPDHYDAAKELMTPLPPSRRGWGIRFRRRAR